eukprot:757991-Hanusia_phi.AAC.4
MECSDTRCPSYSPPSPPLSYPSPSPLLAYDEFQPTGGLVPNDGQHPISGGSVRHALATGCHLLSHSLFSSSFLLLPPYSYSLLLLLAPISAARLRSSPDSPHLAVGPICKRACDLLPLLRIFATPSKLADAHSLALPVAPPPCPSDPSQSEQERALGDCEAVDLSKVRFVSVRASQHWLTTRVTR